MYIDINLKYDIFTQKITHAREHDMTNLRYKFEPSDDAKKIFGPDNKDYRLGAKTYEGRTPDETLSLAFGSKGLPYGVRKLPADKKFPWKAVVWLNKESSYNPGNKGLSLGIIEAFDADQIPSSPSRSLPPSLADEKKQGIHPYAEWFRTSGPR
jgi:hypothetical protein